MRRGKRLAMYVVLHSTVYKDFGQFSKIKKGLINDQYLMCPTAFSLAPRCNIAPKVFEVVCIQVGSNQMPLTAWKHTERHRHRKKYLMKLQGIA